jgi:hypothetical protein
VTQPKLAGQPRPTARQPQGAVPGTRAGGAKALERPVQPGDLLRRDVRPAVGHGEGTVVVFGRGAQADEAGWGVVSDGVVEEVSYQPADEVAVAGDERRLDVDVDSQSRFGELRCP